MKDFFISFVLPMLAGILVSLILLTLVVKCNILDIEKNKYKITKENK